MRPPVACYNRLPEPSQQIGNDVQLGLMTHHIHRSDIDGVADAIAGYGLSSVQLNLDSAGLPEIPDAFDGALAERIRAAFARHDIRIGAVSGTFNMIDPDRARLEEHIRRFPVLMQWCRALDCSVVSACTGTRNPNSMWRHHPDNARPEAWLDMRRTLDRLLPVAESHGVVVAFEPEVVNVVDTAAKARRLIDEVASPSLRVIMDPANYFHPDMLPQMDAALEEVFQNVGAYIALAHAKDVRGPNPGGTECVRPAAGTGVLDYARYMQLLQRSGYDGALVMHSLDEAEVPASAAYVRRFLDHRP